MAAWNQTVRYGVSEGMDLESVSICLTEQTRCYNHFFLRKNASRQVVTKTITPSRIKYE